MESKEIGEPAIRNKVDNDNLIQKNLLGISFVYNNIEYITILSSYSYPFDILGKYLFQILYNTVSKNVENIEYMLELTQPLQPGNTA